MRSRRSTSCGVSWARGASGPRTGCPGRDAVAVVGRGVSPAEGIGARSCDGATAGTIGADNATDGFASGRDGEPGGTGAPPKGEVAGAAVGGVGDTTGAATAGGEYSSAAEGARVGVSASGRGGTVNAAGRRPYAAASGSPVPGTAPADGSAWGASCGWVDFVGCEKGPCDAKAWVTGGTAGRSGSSRGGGCRGGVADASGWGVVGGAVVD